MKKINKILVSCYACSPNRGSEPGMGWNFVKGISENHEVHVIVEQEKWELEIEDYINKYPKEVENLHFYFIKKKRSRKLRKIWPPSYYYFYRQWQKKAYKLALELNEKENFNLVHQLNMVGYREPGYLWKIDIPFVWGPIGGLETTPWSFLPSLGLKGMMHFTARNIINLFQKYISIRPRKAAKRNNNSLISATPETQKEIYKIWNRESIVITEVGSFKTNIREINTRENEVLIIVWSGLHEPRKNLGLLLESLALVDVNWELHILGEGTETKKWKWLSKKLNLSDRCIWYGWQPLDKALDVFKKGHVFTITSVHDLTSTVILEALSFGLPIVCLDHCGFSHVVDDSCGIKISVTTPKNAKYEFSKAIEKLYADEMFRQKLAKGALLRAECFSWEKKIDKLNIIYEKLLK